MAGCRDPHRHAPQLLALLDGVILNQLLQPATELGRENVIDQLERFFAGLLVQTRGSARKVLTEMFGGAEIADRGRRLGAAVRLQVPAGARALGGQGRARAQGVGGRDGGRARRHHGVARRARPARACARCASSRTRSRASATADPKPRRQRSRRRRATPRGGRAGTAPRSVPTPTSATDLRRAPTRLEVSRRLTKPPRRPLRSGDAARPASIPRSASARSSGASAGSPRSTSRAAPGDRPPPSGRRRRRRRGDRLDPGAARRRGRRPARGRRRSRPRVASSTAGSTPPRARSGRARRSPTARSRRRSAARGPLARSARRWAATRCRSSCPCHRVVAAGGASGGFSAPGGVRTKLRMLAIEAPHAPGTLPLFA